MASVALGAAVLVAVALQPGGVRSASGGWAARGDSFLVASQARSASEKGSDIPRIASLAGLAGCGKTVAGKRQIGVVKKIKGGLSLQRAGKWQKARVGMALYQKDRVRTGGGQRALVQSCDKSRLFLNHGTDATFPSAVLTDVKQGEARQVVPAGKRHELRTPHANAVGPDVDVRVSGSSSTFIAVHGAAQVQNDKGSRVLKQNKETVVHPGGAPTTPVSVDAARATSWTSELSSPSPPTPTPTPTRVPPTASPTPSPTPVQSTPSTTPTATPAGPPAPPSSALVSLRSARD